MWSKQAWIWWRWLLLKGAGCRQGKVHGRAWHCVLDSALVWQTAPNPQLQQGKSCHVPRNGSSPPPPNSCWEQRQRNQRGGGRLGCCAREGCRGQREGKIGFNISHKSSLRASIYILTGDKVIESSSQCGGKEHKRDYPLHFSVLPSFEGWGFIALAILFDRRKFPLMCLFGAFCPV